jgi:hypothetical protein
MYSNKRNNQGTIWNIPEDILYEIFLYLSTKALLDCCLVCHRWRRIALDRPALWTIVDVELLYYRAGTTVLERSRNLPLNLDFPDYPPESFEDLEIRRISNALSRTKSITNLNLIALENLPVVLPDLVSLEMTQDSPRMNLLKGSHRLLHLSMQPDSLRSIADMPFNYRLRTLHIYDRPPSLHVTLLSLANLPALKELLIHDENYPSRGGDNKLIFLPGVDPLDDDKYSRATSAISRLPTLDFLWIRGYHDHDISRILVSSLIRPSTHIHLEVAIRTTTALAIDHRNKDTISSLWVRSKENDLLLVQDNVFTEIKLYRDDITEGNFMSTISAFINPLCITSLSLDGTGNPPPIGLLRQFPNLVNLHFLFLHSKESAPLRSVSTTLNNELAVSFPRLEFIGLTLRNTFPFSPTPYGDGAEYAVKDFLQSWIRMHGAVFRTIRIQDAIKPTRWERHVTILTTLVGSFELGHMRSQPGFPTPRLFGEKDRLYGSRA